MDDAPSKKDSGSKKKKKRRKTTKIDDPPKSDSVIIDPPFHQSYNYPLPLVIEGMKITLQKVTPL